MIFLLDRVIKMTPEQRREELIRALAAYLTDDVSNKTTLLSVGHHDSILWAMIYSAANVRPWATEEQAIEDIRRTLNMEEQKR